LSEAAARAKNPADKARALADVKAFEGEAKNFLESLNKTQAPPGKVGGKPKKSDKPPANTDDAAAARSLLQEFFTKDFGTPAPAGGDGFVMQEGDAVNRSNGQVMRKVNGSWVRVH
jgi:hypothetical protein